MPHTTPFNSWDNDIVIKSAKVDDSNLFVAILSEEKAQVLVFAKNDFDKHKATKIPLYPIAAFHDDEAQREIQITSFRNGEIGILLKKNDKAEDQFLKQPLPQNLIGFVKCHTASVAALPPISNLFGAVIKEVEVLSKGLLVTLTNGRTATLQIEEKNWDFLNYEISKDRAIITCNFRGVGIHYNASIPYEVVAGKLERQVNSSLTMSPLSVSLQNN